MNYINSLSLKDLKSNKNGNPNHAVLDYLDKLHLPHTAESFEGLNKEYYIQTAKLLNYVPAEHFDELISAPPHSTTRNVLGDLAIMRKLSYEQTLTGLADSNSEEWMQKQLKELLDLYESDITDGKGFIAAIDLFIANEYENNIWYALEICNKDQLLYISEKVDKSNLSKKCKNFIKPAIDLEWPRVFGTELRLSKSNEVRSGIFLEIFSTNQPQLFITLRHLLNNDDLQEIINLASQQLNDPKQGKKAKQRIESIVKKLV